MSNLLESQTHITVNGQPIEQYLQTECEYAYSPFDFTNEQSLEIAEFVAREVKLITRSLYKGKVS